MVNFCDQSGCTNLAMPDLTKCRKHALRPKQAAMLQWIRDFVAREDYSPTIQEIADGLNVSSKNTVAYYLRQLEALGHLSHAPKKPRGIVLREPIQSRSQVQSGSLYR